MQRVFANGPVLAIQTLHREEQIVTYFRALVARKKSENSKGDPEDAAATEINAVLSRFAPPVQARWRKAIPELE